MAVILATVSRKDNNVGRREKRIAKFVTKVMMEQLKIARLKRPLAADTKGHNDTAPVIRDERLKRFVHQKLSYTVAEGPFCILYIHTGVQKEENSPGISTLRWIYEDLPLDYKKRLEVVYFLHPGIQSRLVMATLGRFFLSESLYWKIKYISRVEFMWNDIKKGQIERPDFVYKHDTMLENRPLMDYGIEADPYNLHAGPGLDYSFSKFGYR